VPLNKFFEEFFKFQLGRSDLVEDSKFSNIKNNITFIYILFVLDLLNIKNKNNYFLLKYYEFN